MDAQLVFLQLAQVRDHYCVLVVGHNHRLELRHVVSGKLSKTVVHHAAQLAVALPLTVKNFLDIVFALLQVRDHFLKVLKHQGFVAKQTLVFHERADLILLNFLAFALLKDGHRVEVVLAEKDHIQAGLFKLSEFE